MIALENGGSTAGRVQNLDRIVLTFNATVNTATVGTCNGATKSGTDLVFTQGQNAAGDTVTANGVRLSIGSIDLGGQGYMQNRDTSTCAWTAGNTVLTITVQGIARANTSTVAGSKTATYTPNAAIQSAAGASIDTTAKPSVTAVLF